MTYAPTYETETTGYFIDWKNKTYEFRTVEDYMSYLNLMQNKKFKDFPRLEKRMILNLFLVEFEGRKLDELELEDEMMGAEPIRECRYDGMILAKP